MTAAPVAAAWETYVADDRPVVCVRCGAWTRPDGTPGPRLPDCTTPGWAHPDTCSKVRFGTFPHDLCAPCVDTMKKEP